MSTPRPLQRVVLPSEPDADVMPLYVDFAQASAPRSGTTALTGAPVTKGAKGVAAPAVQSSDRLVEQHPEHVLDRRRLRVPVGTRVSFATYFNAFPASYWKRWTTLQEVELRVRVSGPARVAVYRSSSSGNSERVETARNDSDGTAEFTFALPLNRFVDGGWYWFDVAAGVADVVVEGAEWLAPSSQQSTGDEAPGTVTLGITTFNRPSYALALLRQLAGSAEVLDVVDEIVVVDQGTRKVREQEGFAQVEHDLGGRLRVIDQANLGGSGGFARGMYETLQGGRSRYVLVMDDDVTSETESILRALSFADRCRRPTIVGGHMFDMFAPSRLLHFGEVVKPWRYHFQPADGITPDHDFREQSLRGTSWMHRRVDVDYNAWWMCLIPVEVLKTVGLSLPVFIKWDDAEYGLRARKAGFPTVTLPGMAVWHMPFTEKDDVLDWQAYFHLRNRVIAALLHSPYGRGGRLVRDSLYQQIRHLLALQYSAADLRIRALEDLLAGPEGLHAQLPTKLPEIQAARTAYSDARTAPDPEAFPPVGTTRPPGKDRTSQPPVGRISNLVAAGLLGLRHLRPVPTAVTERPQTAVAALDVHWWKLAHLDSALVSTQDGTSVSWYRRDRDRYADLLRRSILLHERLLSEWPALSRRYREAEAELVSPEAWARTFEGLSEAPR